MNYPVDLTKKYVLYNTATKEAEKIKINWPRLDGMEIMGLDKNYRYLEYFEAPKPKINPNEKLVKLPDSVQLSQNRYVISWGKEIITDPQALYKIKVNQGYLVEPENFRLAVGESDQNAFVRMLTLLNLTQAPDSYLTNISDITGTVRSVELGRFKQIMVEYGLYCQQLWSETKL